MEKLLKAATQSFGKSGTLRSDAQERPLVLDQ